MAFCECESFCQVTLIGSSSAVRKTLMTCSLGSHLSSGVNHQLKIARMVTAPKMTPACHLNHRIDQICVREGRKLRVNPLTKLNVSAVTGKKNGETWTENTIALKNAAAT